MFQASFLVCEFINRWEHFQISSVLKWVLACHTYYAIARFKKIFIGTVIMDSEATQYATLILIG
jgi:hypothetical protein